jgi:hypothetical protein
VTGAEKVPATVPGPSKPDEAANWRKELRARQDAEKNPEIKPYLLQWRSRPGHAFLFARVGRCAFLLGEEPHDRKKWIEHRLEERGNIFAVAKRSNHRVAGASRQLSISEIWSALTA